MGWSVNQLAPVSIQLAISRNDLLALANEKILDAEALYLASRYDGAAYVCGYSIELFLKYRLCKQLKWAEFPKTNREFQCFQSLKTHDLDTLLKLSGIERMVRRQYLADWSILLNWSPENRYGPVGLVSAKDASEMIKSAKVLIGKI
jgi:HEPN domain-containing protein